MEYQNNELTDTAVRTYGKTELALMYNPHSSPRAAVQTLKRWIQSTLNCLKSLTLSVTDPSDTRYTALKLS